MKYYNLPTFASTYGSCNYGTDNFDNASTTCASGSAAAGSGSSSGSGAGGSSGGSAGGTLTNTGFDVVLAASIACVIIFAALVVRFVRKPAKRAGSTDTPA